MSSRTPTNADRREDIRGVGSRPASGRIYPRPGRLLLLLAVLSSCVPALREAGPSIIDFRFEAEREELFQAALRVGQQLNLDVKVLDRESGLIRFERAALSAEELDSYCEYVFRSGCTPLPGSYEGHRKAGQSVYGNMSLTVLFTDRKDGETDLNIRANWSVTIARGGYFSGVYNVESTGVFEKKFHTMLQAELGADKKVDAPPSTPEVKATPTRVKPASTPRRPAQKSKHQRRGKGL
jgi:hypothetical protein